MRRGSAAADGDDDFETIALGHHDFGMTAAGHDFAVALDRDPPPGMIELGDERGDGQRRRKLAAFAIDQDIHWAPILARGPAVPTPAAGYAPVIRLGRGAERAPAPPAPDVQCAPDASAAAAAFFTGCASQTTAISARKSSAEARNTSLAPSI